MTASLIERLSESLAERDAAVSECPVNHPTPRNPSPGLKACQRCGAKTSEPCGLAVSADHTMVGVLRANLGHEASQ